MPNTAELLVKEAEGILEHNVLVPIIMQKCADRGYTPQNDEEVGVLLKVASDIRAKIASGELAPVPVSALDAEGKMSKEASDKLSADPLAFGEDINVKLEEVDATVKEAAAVVTWASLEDIAEQQTASK